ncbi:MAG: phosphoribosylglycinamide formyltransferase [Clostridia bacterium]
MSEGASRRARIAVLVSGGGTNLQAILDADARGEMPSGEVVCVISNVAGAYALTRAENAGIPALCCVREAGEAKAAFEERLGEMLKENGAELIVLAGFMVILSADFVKRYPDRIVNVHPALIPSFCGKGFYGLHVHEAALARGVKVTGATVHLVNEIPDGGRILLQKAVEILPGDTPERLQRRVMEQAEWQLLPKAVQMLSEQICGKAQAREG